MGAHVAAVDIEGYVHLFSRANGNYVGRLATDGSATTGQPNVSGGRLVFQTVNGNVYAIATRSQ